MSRTSMSARALMGAAALALALPTIAMATTPAPEVKLSRAPWSVSFGDTATIRGRVEGASDGAKVSLHRRWPSGGWYEHATRRVGSDGSIRFRVRHMKRNARFKLVYSDASTGLRDSSRRATVRIESKVRVDLRRERVMEGGAVAVRGSVRPAGERRVVLQIKRHGRWRSVRHLDLRHGRVRAKLRPGRVGRFPVRVVVGRDRYALGGGGRASAMIFDPTEATWYGPGFYGNRTACGRTLTRSTLGVAHRSMPCGSKVSILFGGRWIAVPVIDRGPYSSAEFDLTEATAERLGFSGRDQIGVVRGRES